jgi:hypothetical protein
VDCWTSRRHRSLGGGGLPSGSNRGQGGTDEDAHGPGDNLGRLGAIRSDRQDDMPRRPGAGTRAPTCSATVASASACLCPSYPVSIRTSRRCVPSRRWPGPCLARRRPKGHREERTAPQDLWDGTQPSQNPVTPNQGNQGNRGRASVCKAFRPFPSGGPGGDLGQSARPRWGQQGPPGPSPVRGGTKAMSSQEVPCYPCCPGGTAICGTWQVGTLLAPDLIIILNGRPT